MGRVLLVEDDVAIAAPLARALEREGHEVQLAQLGQEAIDSMRKGKQDLLILDLGLPDIDGLEVCRTIRVMWSFGNPPLRCGLLFLLDRYSY